MTLVPARRIGGPAQGTLGAALFLVIALLAVPAQAQGSPAAKPEQVTFHLAVPAHSRFVEKRIIKKIVEIGDKSEAEVQTISQTTDIEIRRRGSGFVVSVKPRLDSKGDEPGSAAAGIAAALRGKRIQYEFDSQGNLIAFRGLETFREELASALPSEMMPMVDSLMQRVVEELKDEWRSRYAGLVGLTFKVGYRQTGKMPLKLAPQLPPVTAKIGRGVRTWQPCGDRQCVVFFIGYVVENADGYGEAMSQMLRGWLRQLLSGLGGTDAKSAIKEMEAGMPSLKVTEMLNLIERLVDPQTMMVYFEKRTKGFRGVINGSKSMQWMEVTTLEIKPAD